MSYTKLNKNCQSWQSLTILRVVYQKRGRHKIVIIIIYNYYHFGYYGFKTYINTKSIVFLITRLLLVTLLLL